RNPLFQWRDKRARRARPSTKSPAEAGLGGHEGTHGEQLCPRLTDEARSGFCVLCRTQRGTRLKVVRSARCNGTERWVHCAPVPPGYLLGVVSISMDTRSLGIHPRNKVAPPRFVHERGWRVHAALFFPSCLR